MDQHTRRIVREYRDIAEMWLVVWAISPYQTDTVDAILSHLEYPRALRDTQWLNKVACLVNSFVCELHRAGVINLGGGKPIITFSSPVSGVKRIAKLIEE